MEIVNRRVKHDYFIIDTYEAGIALTGTEIKAVRAGSVNIKDCYGTVKKGEVYLLNMYIGEYKEGNIFNHDETRTRKLLLHKKEILKINDAISKEGLTLIPYKLYFKNNILKVELCVCKGKKNYDKREAIKERDTLRELKRDFKNLHR